MHILKIHLLINTHLVLKHWYIFRAHGGWLMPNTGWWWVTIPTAQLYILLSSHIYVQHGSTRSHRQPPWCTDLYKMVADQRVLANQPVLMPEWTWSALRLCVPHWGHFLPGWLQCSAAASAAQGSRHGFKSTICILSNTVECLVKPLLEPDWTFGTIPLVQLCQAS